MSSLPDIIAIRRNKTRPNQDKTAEYTEDNVALGFVADHPDFRRVELHATWLRWNNGAWLEDNTLAVYDAVRKYCRQIAPTSDRVRLRMGRATVITAIERLCRSDQRYAMTPDQFDADDWVLNTPKGLVDLKKGKLLPHDRNQYCKKMTAVAPVGDCPRWLEFLDQVTGKDMELIAYLKRLVGYCLTGLTREHSIHFVDGSGANGKSVFLNTITGIFSDYAYVAPTDTFTEARGERHPTELAAIDGARLVVSQETESGRRWAQSRIKSLSAGDPQTARKMRRDLYTFSPKCKIVIAGNAKPRLSTVDEAMRRRWQIAPFTVCIPPANRDPELSEKLVAEWPGILAWAVEGCLEYQKNGLKPPLRVVEATHAYLEAQDLFGDWLETECVRGDEHWSPKKELYNAWKDFAVQAGERPGQMVDFVERMKNAGFRDNKTDKKKRHWLGLKLRPADLSE